MVEKKFQFLKCVVIIFVFNIYIQQEQKQFQFPFIDQYLDQITNQQIQKCYQGKYAITTDKPVYKNQEIVQIQMYSYNLINKKPLKGCRNNIYQNLKIYDANENEIAAATKDFQEDGLFQDYFLLSYKFVIQNLKSGKYYIKIQNLEYDKTFFYVLNQELESRGIQADWNLDTVKKSDVVKGNFVFQTLDTKIENFDNSYYKYELIDHTGQQYYSSEKIQMNSNKFDIQFIVPQNFQRILYFNLQLFLQEQMYQYKKEFIEFIYDNVDLNFTIENGLIVCGHNNIIKFTAYQDKTQKIPIQIQNAKILKKLGNNRQVVKDNLNTISDGRGFFNIMITEEDCQNNSSFVMLVNFDEYVQKEYSIFDLNSKQQLSEVYLQMPKKIIKQNSLLDITLYSKKFNGIVAIFIGKGQYLLKVKTVEIEDEITNINLDIQDLSPGKYTLSIYRKQIKESEKQQVGYQDWQQKVDAVILQEVDFYIYPSKILNPEFKILDSNYSPGDTVDFQIDLRQCDFCLKQQNFKSLLTIVDKSVYLKISKENIDTSLITKIMLQNEIYNKIGKLFKAWKFIEGYFEANKYKNITGSTNQDLELLLNNQKESKLFFEAQNFGRYYQNRYDQEKQISKELKNFISYFLEDESIMYGRPEELMMAEDEAMPMVGMANNAPQPKMMKAGAPMMKKKGVRTSQPQQTQEDINYIKNTSTILSQFFTEPSNNNSQINGKFQIPDKDVTMYIIIFAFDDNGNYGILKQDIQLQKEISVDIKMPQFITRGEKFAIEIQTNNNKQVETVINFIEPQDYKLQLKQKENKVIKMYFEADNLPFNIKGHTSESDFNFLINPVVINDGVQIIKTESIYFSQQINSLSLQSYIPETYVNKSAQISVCYKNSSIQMILDAIESLNKIPCGCFEQASSTNFPLVLALKILLRTGSNIELQNKMIENLKKGIKLLMSYETKTGGFEWFGKSPGHTTLTAYGLWQFTEIKNLDTDQIQIDDGLFDRIQKFFMQNINKEEGFTITQGLDSFGNPEQMTSDLYIIFVLSKTNLLKGSFENQIKKIEQTYEGYKNGSVKLDTYKLALIGLTKFYLQKLNEAEEILNIIIKQQDKDGKINMSENSITRSTGKPLEVETTALFLILLMQINFQKYSNNLDLGIKFLVKSMKKGYFQSTQGTILSLIVFDMYFDKISSKNENTQQLLLELQVQNKYITQFSVDITKLDESQCVTFDDEIDANLIKNSQNEISIILKNNQDINSSHLISLSFLYNDTLPQDSTQSNLEFLQFDTILNNGVLMYNIQLKNQSQKEQGMVLLEINIPSCSQVDLDMLELLVKSNKIDYYELRENESQIVMYWRGMEDFSVIKKFEQQCSQKTSRAYLYYQQEDSLIYSRPEIILRN